MVDLRSLASSLADGPSRLASVLQASDEHRRAVVSIERDLARSAAQHAAIINALDTSAYVRTVQAAVDHAVLVDSLKPLRGLLELPDAVASALRELRAATDFTSLRASLKEHLDSLSLPSLRMAEYVDSVRSSQQEIIRSLGAVARATAAKTGSTHAAQHAEAIEAEISEQFAAPSSEAGSARDLLSATASAVQSVASTARGRADWKYWSSIALALLLFLIQWHQSHEATLAVAQSLDSLQAVLGSAGSTYDALVDALGSPASVMRPSWLHQRPWPSSTRVLLLPSDASVIVLRRYRRWTLVVYDAPEPARRHLFGWVLNKYLAKR